MNMATWQDQALMEIWNPVIAFQHAMIVTSGFSKWMAMDASEVCSLRFFGSELQLRFAVKLGQLRFAVKL